MLSKDLCAYFRHLPRNGRGRQFYARRAHLKINFAVTNAVQLQSGIKNSKTIECYCMIRSNLWSSAFFSKKTDGSKSALPVLVRYSVNKQRVPSERPENFLEGHLDGCLLMTSRSLASSV